MPGPEGESADNNSEPSDEQPQGHPLQVEDIINKISTRTFEAWYQERTIRKNLRQGKPHYNKPTPAPHPQRHSPSSLLQCHRKIYYRQLNAPREEKKPAGIFWTGSRFEEEFVLPYLEDISDEHYAANSIWTDFTIQTNDGELQFRGETDPVIVDESGTPVLLTEVKTKKSVENISSPNPHHRAQAHAYMFGLSEEYDQQITDAVIIYGSRTSFTIQPYHVEFDIWFWTNSVLHWAEEHTKYRTQGELPPAEPEANWECNLCEYRHRCGQSDQDYADLGSDGLLPLFQYPRGSVEDYLEARPETSAKLTPTLAHCYPDLTEDYDVYDWCCVACESQFEWDNDRIDYKQSSGEPPTCPHCTSHRDMPGSLRGPSPAQQLTSSGNQGDDSR